jgi:anti-sigma factor RsiW
MNSQLPPQDLTTGCHLTSDQFGDLMTGAATGPVEAHLDACGQCAAEAASLRDSISLFRQASTAYAEDQLRALPPLTIPSRRLHSPSMQPTFWAVAAALLLAAFLPMQSLHRQQVVQPVASATAASIASQDQVSTQESDEALLQDVDREASASLPVSMQALADPTADHSYSIQTSSQRKD